MTNKILIFAMFSVIGLTLNLAYAAGGKVTDPTGIAPDRYVYYPGTEELAKERFVYLLVVRGYRQLDVLRLQPVGWLSWVTVINFCLMLARDRWLMWQH